MLYRRTGPVGMNDRAFFMYKPNAMNHVLMRIVVWVIAYIIQWLIEKRREHINQNRNAVINAVAKN